MVSQPESVSQSDSAKHFFLAIRNYTQLQCMCNIILLNSFSFTFMSEMYTVLMAACAVTGRFSEEWVVKCVDLLLERNARVNVYDK